MRALEEENKILRQDVQQGSQLRDELDRRLREAQERAASEQARADATVAEAARKDGDIAKLRQLVTEVCTDRWAGRKRMPFGRGLCC